MTERDVIVERRHVRRSPPSPSQSSSIVVQVHDEDEERVRVVEARGNRKAQAFTSFSSYSYYSVDIVVWSTPTRDRRGRVYVYGATDELVRYRSRWRRRRRRSYRSGCFACYSRLDYPTGAYYIVYIHIHTRIHTHIYYILRFSLYTRTRYEIRYRLYISFYPIRVSHILCTPRKLQVKARFNAFL